MPRSSKSHSGTCKSPTAAPAASASSSTSQTPAPLIEERLKAHREKREAYFAQRNDEILPLKNRGNGLFKSGNYWSAGASYMQAIDMYGPHPVLFSNLAAVFLKLDKFKNAEDAATAALHYEPTNLKVRYRRGQARKERHKFRAAISDFTTIIENDPSHHEAAEELERTKHLFIAFGDPSDFDNDDDDDDDFYGGPYDDFDDEYDDDTNMEFESESDDDYDWPYYGSYPLLSLSTGYESDSNDYRHRGNGFPCKFYNHDGCSRGTTCSYSHAPDNKSQRDELGRNVCIYFLIDRCKYGDSMCVYSHDKTYLGKGWWQDQQVLAGTREIFQYLDPQEFGDHLECFLHSLTRPPHKLFFAGALLETAGSAPSHELKPPSERFVLRVQFDRMEDDDYKKPLFAAISSRINLVKAFAKEAVGLLSSPHIIGVFLADAYIIRRKHTRLLAKLIDYVKGGGTLVLGGSFSTFFPVGKFDSFFEKIWGVPWQHGSYHRTTFKVNPANELAKKNPSLLSSYSMKALHVKNASGNDTIYKPTSQSRVESLVFAPDRITDLAESPAVYTSIGKGHLGYVGDVNWEDGSTKVILAMLGLLDPKSGSPKPQPSSSSTATKSARSPPAASTTAKPNAATVAPTRGLQPIASSSSSSTAFRPQAKQEIASTLPDPQPFIITLAFGREKSFFDTQPDLVSALEKKLEILHTLSIPRVLDLLSSKDLRGILITQPDIVDPENGYLLAQLIKYVKAGGRIVLGGFFPAMIEFDTVEPFFKQWGLEWIAGDYTSAKMWRNRSHELVEIEKNNESNLALSGVMSQNRLPETVHMKALHLSGVGYKEAVYFGTQRGHSNLQAAIVHTKVGEGRLGYIGDVGLGEDHTKIVLRMFDLLL